MARRRAVAAAGRYLLRFLMVLVVLAALGAALVLVQVRTGAEPAPVSVVAIVVALIIIAFAAWLAMRFFAEPLDVIISWIENLSTGLYEPPASVKSSIGSAHGWGAAWRPFADVFVAMSSLTDSLDEAERERSRLQLARDEWIIGVSHDLKSPLSCVRGYAQLLESDGTASAEARRQGRAILDQALAMERLLADLRLAARLQSTGAPRSFESVDLVRLAAEVASDASAEPFARGYSVRFDAEAADLVVSGDEHLLRRVLSNLVGNAIIHNAEGTDVLVRAYSSGGRAHALVVDDGQGIEASSRRADRSEGIGLAVARSLVEAHGGGLRVESGERGTTAHLALPLQDPAPTAESAAETQADPRPLQVGSMQVVEE